MKKLLSGFTKFDMILWSISTATVLAAYCLLPSGEPIGCIASLIGITALILLAKGRAAGQILMIIFSLIYAAISFQTKYYGEMLTYLLMTAPMAVFSLISWIRNPYKNGKSVKVATLNAKKISMMLIFTLSVTVVFYFILAYCGTASLLISTISVATSFFAASLTFLRSPYYALGYSLNDIVLIILWSIASGGKAEYIVMVICFSVFLINDMYGFICWQEMKKKQLRDGD